MRMRVWNAVAYPSGNTRNARVRLWLCPCWSLLAFRLFSNSCSHTYVVQLCSGSVVFAHGAGHEYSASVDWSCAWLLTGFVKPMISDLL